MCLERGGGSGPQPSRMREKEGGAGFPCPLNPTGLNLKWENEAVYHTGTQGGEGGGGETPRSLTRLNVRRSSLRRLRRCPSWFSAGHKQECECNLNNVLCCSMMRGP